MNKELKAQREFADRLLDELASERLVYVERSRQFRALPEGEERDTAEGDVYAWLTQLESSAVQAREASDRADDLELALEAASV